MNFQSAFQFLSELKENNNKPWFDINRKRYEEMKKDWEQTVEEIIKTIAAFDPGIADLKAKECIFRINRDVRFSKDKSPYKTNISAYFSKGGKKSPYAGYYVHVDPNECFIAGGMWMPEPPQLQAVRQEIDYHLEEFKGIIEKSSFVALLGSLENEKISTVPKGYEKDNPAAEYLKYKSFIAIRKVPQKEIDKDFLKTIATTCKEIKPLVDFLNKTIQEV